MRKTSIIGLNGTRSLMRYEENRGRNEIKRKRFVKWGRKERGLVKID